MINDTTFFYPILSISNDIRLWIYLPTILVILLNFSLFIIYQQSHQGGALAEQLWGYFESPIFGGLTASLLFPIFLSLLERRFRIIENIEQERKERQLESIKESSQKWNEFYSITNEVVYFRKTGSNNHIYDVLKRLDDSRSNTIDLIVTWKAMFSYLTTKDIDMIKYLDNVLYSATKSVGNFINESDDKEEISKLQMSLGIIQRVIGNYGHYYGLQILLSIIQLQDNELTVIERDRILSNKDKLLSTMKNWITFFSKYESERNILLSSIEDDKTRDFRTNADKIQKWMKEHKDIGTDSEEFSKYQGSEEYKVFFKSFYLLPIEKRAYAEKFPYSKQYIISLADYLSLSIMVGDIHNRTYYL